MPYDDAELDPTFRELRLQDEDDDDLDDDDEEEEDE